MSLMEEYINKKFSTKDYINELKKLIKKYNKIRNTYLMVYCGSTAKKNIADIALCMDDYYVIFDLLRNKKSKNLDFYMETPGGSGEAAEEIVRFLRKEFDNIVFVVSGEAKSAGTLMVMAGNDIIMTESGSLGPIDAQIKIGRSVISASDYTEWVDDKRKEAEINNQLNPFDALMIAQISPGEIKLVRDAFEYAKDLFKKWLPQYKFEHWDHTETRKIKVTEQMKIDRAEEIAKALLDRTKWRMHGRSIKIEDLEDIKLKVIRADDDHELSDVIYRIQTVLRLLQVTSNIYKTFTTADHSIVKTATSLEQAPYPPQKPNLKKADVIEIEIPCPKCNKKYKMYAKFKDDPQIDEKYKETDVKEIPNNKNLKCDCGFEIDLSGIINQIESETDKKIITKEEKKDGKK